MPSELDLVEYTSIVRLGDTWHLAPDHQPFSRSDHLDVAICGRIVPPSWVMGTILSVTCEDCLAANAAARLVRSRHDG